MSGWTSYWYTHIAWTKWCNVRDWTFPGRLVDIGCRSERLMWIFSSGLFLLNLVTRLQASITKVGELRVRVQYGCFFPFHDAGWILGSQVVLILLSQYFKRSLRLGKTVMKPKPENATTSRIDIRDPGMQWLRFSTTHAYSAMKGWIKKLSAVQGHIVTWNS